jgi:hypothetical protein
MTKPIVIALAVVLVAGAVLACSSEPDYRPCAVCGAQVAISPEPALNHWISGDSVVCSDCWKMLNNR